ncbi:MAG: YheC/YheD family protein [Syntrophomonas sp.]
MHEFKMLLVKTNTKQGNDILVISSNLVNELELKENQNISLRVGQLQKTFSLKIEKTTRNNNSIHLSSHVARTLLLHAERRYGYFYTDGDLRIGPVVGVMAELSNQTGRPFGGQSFFIKQLMTSGYSIGQLCFGFSPFGINWKSKTIQGYTYGERGWIKSVFPIPDVVYPRQQGYSNIKLQIRRRLEAMGVKFLNPALIGKWQTYRIIRGNPQLIPYIPDTKLINSFQEVDGMIKKYHAIYLKPVTGSMGRNIVRVVKKRNSPVYQYQYQMNDQSFSGSASNLAQLRASLRPVMGNRTYIAQKQINLLRSDGNIVDVRIMVQKDHTGLWSITGMACRVGRSGSITSNISRGGSGRKLESVLKSKFEDEEQRNNIVEEIKFLALESAKCLEKSIGPSGEMGVDIGIDKDGHIWFIEANLRPARQVFTLIGEKQTRMLSVGKPMLYSRYLAGF